MARLAITCLGSFQVALDGQLVTGFKSAKVRALLTYLAVEADRPHLREVLAGLLWPDWPDRDALSNLRYALSDLRGAIGDRTAEPPFLLITRDSLQFNGAADCWLDVAEFTRRAEPALHPGRDPDDLSGLEEAIALYRGRFMEGFSVGDSDAFESWLGFKREQIAQQNSSALGYLAAAYERRGELERARSWVRQQLEWEPWAEEAHRRLMRLLALGGQRGAALAQYGACRRLLSEELGVEPAAETTALYEQIRDGKLRVDIPAAPIGSARGRPPFLDQDGLGFDRPPLYAREPELAQLDRFLDMALAARGRTVFVIGEAGSGKSALLQKFATRAQDAHDDLIVASGNCNAHVGIGDPYLPFREILGLLTGDVETRWAAGALSRDHALRLWKLVPLAARTLLEAAPDLIGTFVPGSALLDRARASAPAGASWLTGLADRVLAPPADAPTAPAPQQSDVFEQVTRVIKTVARQMPLVLLVDDLQWADLGSISLLFHLGRNLAGSRILIVGAYRPEEVAIGRDGARHPLEPVTSELQRLFGDITVDLDRAQSRLFVEAFLDGEPNRLASPFREMLYRQTRGHPLFTIELLRGMQERNDLVRDDQQRWVEGPALSWETLPARVEAVIAERIGRLARPLQATLRIACVEGLVFTAEVVADLLGTSEREILGQLSGELDRNHRLIQADSIVRVDGQLLSFYRFRHILYQKYLYSTLDEVERVHLHEQVGTSLENLYGVQEGGAGLADISPQLARHFEEAGMAEKAIHYLHQAGERAIRLSAYQEGIVHLNRGLALLSLRPESPKRAKQELGLQLALGKAWLSQGTPRAEVKDAFSRARDLSRQLSRSAELGHALGELALHYYVRADYRTACQLGQEALSLAESSADPLQLALGHWYLGLGLFGLGEYTAARDHFEKTISFYRPHHHHRAFVSLRGSDAGVSAMAYRALCLWCLGYPEQAQEQSRQALALARELGHPLSLVDVLSYSGCMLNEMRRDAQALLNDSEELIQLARDSGLPGWVAFGTGFRGQALARLGQTEEGIEQIQQSLAANEARDAWCYVPSTLCSLAEAYAQAGRPAEGLAALDRAVSLVERTGEGHWEAELYRVRAELLLMQNDGDQAEASLNRAVEVARNQHARSWELRAAVVLGRLWRMQGKRAEAREMLTEIVGWFSEGFETADLQAARELLSHLS
jgi:DNA-binding SARP family transcriptional activator